MAAGDLGIDLVIPSGGHNPPHTVLREPGIESVRVRAPEKRSPMPSKMRLEPYGGRTRTAITREGLLKAPAARNDLTPKVCLYLLRFPSLPLSYATTGHLHSLWGGRPRPRPAPWPGSGRVANCFCSNRQAVPGRSRQAREQARGPCLTGLLQNLGNGKLSGIGHECLCRSFPHH
jgi:hypothetical protein